MNLKQALAEELRQIQRRGLLRKLTDVQGPVGPRIDVNGRELVLLCGNDYLGLASRPELIEAARLAAQTYGTGSGASRSISGNLAPHRELERSAAAFAGLPDALCFSSGALANIGLVQSLAGPDDAVLSDELNHATIIDGVRLSRARKVIYPHTDLDALERGLKDTQQARRRLVITESLFSMDGDSPPLERMAELCSRRDAWLIVDEAHALGVLGPQGRGLAAGAGITQHIAALVGTFGKAFGSQGAFVAGPAPLRDYLINSCRTFIFSTAPSPAVSAAAGAGIALAARMDVERAGLLASSDAFRSRLRELGFTIPGGNGPIVPLILGSEAAAIRAQEILWEQGVWVQAIRPPTVPTGTSRLRISLRADLSEADLAIALNAFQQLAKRL